MKLGPVTKLGKRNTVPSRKFDDDVVSADCGVIVIFPIYGQFGAIRKPNSGRMICNVRLTFSLTVTLYLTKTENKTQKSLSQLA